MTNATKRGRGRPAKPADEKRDSKILVAFTGAERDIVDSAAGDTPVSTWARDVLLRAAKRAARTG